MATVKTTFAAALLVAFLAAATATTFDEQQQQLDCQLQLVGRTFRSCQRYLIQGVLQMTTGYSGLQQQQQLLQECCQQLQGVNQKCSCDAIKKVVRLVRQEGEVEEREVLEKANDLSGMCNLSPCRISVV